MFGDLGVIFIVPLPPAGGEADRLDAASKNSVSPSDEGTESPVNEQFWYFRFRVLIVKKRKLCENNTNIKVKVEEQVGYGRTMLMFEKY